MRHKQDLLARLNNKEHAAIEEIFKHYYASLKGLAYRSIEDEAEAEDIIMKLFHKLATTQSVFNSMEELKAYLFVAVKNHCKNYWQKKQRRENILTTSPLPPQPNTQESNANNNLDYRDLTKLVGAKLKQLPKQCRTVAEHILIRGMEPGDVAKTLNIPINQVNAQFSRARRHLKAVLPESADFDIPAIFILLAILALLSFH